MSRENSACSTAAASPHNLYTHLAYQQQKEEEEDEEEGEKENLPFCSASISSSTLRFVIIIIALYSIHLLSITI